MSSSQSAEGLHRCSVPLQVDSDSFRRLFPVSENICYLNHCRRGPTSGPAALAARQWLDEMSGFGVHRDLEPAACALAQQQLAEFVGAMPEELAILGNATEGLARVLSALTWRAGDHVVVPRRDYPGVTLPVECLRRAGVEVTYVEDGPHGFVTVEMVLAALTPRTRLVVASHVNFWSGHRLDVERLCRECQRRGVLTAIDAVQSVGALQVNLSEMGCDVATFVSRKWLLGADSVGFLFVRQAAVEHFTPSMLGAASSVASTDRFALDSPPAPSARRFELGGIPTIGLIAAAATANTFRMVGVSEIERAILAWSGEFRRRAEHAGLALIGSNAPEYRESGINAVHRRGGCARADLPQRLNTRRICVSVESTIVRVAPHAYSTVEDLDRVLDALFD